MSHRRRRNLRPLAGWMLVAAAVPVFAEPVFAHAAPPVEATRPRGWDRQPPVEAPPPIPPIATLVGQLDSPRFAERQAASRDLARGGPAAIPALVEASGSDRPEVSARAVAALEAFWLRAMDRGEWPLAEQAQFALGDLAVDPDADPSVAGRCGRILAARQDVIEARALAAVRRFGGLIVYEGGGGIYVYNDDGTASQVIGHVIVPTGWTGGEDGLRYLRSLKRVQQIYIVRGAVPEEATAALAAAVGGNVVQRRGQTQLGVGRRPTNGGGCLIDSVKPGGSADKAGMLPGDVVVSFDGKPVDDFEELVDTIYPLAPGATVPATIVRNGFPIELKITMEPWE